ncbi:DUF2213 domain-containing protein [Asticcacaulis endophyticus]|uniref:DUF2213 domain-containing protein n=1 Tax=Asticcacaulis endophyticus TaxID=1395890 RepID=A0A918UMZ0_9CAUL|nr:DUF2213 domain-containing protein [Asticcacaulis endophyticus]GGZ21791.1 hypothetical protein GCM10011273_03220 [Asticcacaulis endophyticus]
MQFTDAVTVAGTRRSADGYLIAEARAVRTGVQIYTGSEMGVTDKAVVRVYRPAEEVFSDESLRSASHMPITIDHPKDGVTADNWKELAAGEVSTLAKKDGEWVQFPLIVKDAAAIKAFEAGKRELSAGYTCVIDWVPGVTADGEEYDAVQRHIKFNHLALVDRARAGSKARIGDGAISWGAAPITVADERNPHMPDNLRNVMVDGLSVSTTDQGAQAIDKLTKDRDAAAAKLSDADTAHKAAIASKDEEIGTLKADLKKAQDGAPKPADLDKLVADRAALVSTVNKLDGKIDVSGKSDAELRRAAVVSKLGDEMAKDASDAEISGMFKAIAKDAKPADPFQSVLSDGVAPKGDMRAQADAARNARNQALRDGWKSPADAA